jgi:DNA ligase (NAD+)
MLEEYNYLYYVKNAPAVTDAEFDALMRELEELEVAHPEMDDPNSPTRRVGSDASNDFPRVTHAYGMMSLANTYNEQEVRDFDARVREHAGGSPVEYACELKYDGTAISLRYEHGALRYAATRGDGLQGDDVTTNARTIRSIPLRLRGEGFPALFEIRGEILMPFTVFNRLNEERALAGEPPFVNPRNAAAGTLRLLNPAEVARRRLECYLHSVPGELAPAATHVESMNAAREWGFNVPRDAARCADVEEVLAYIRAWEGRRGELPVPVDGIVVKVNAVDLQERLGYTTKSPRWAIAYKYKAERAESLLLGVDYQVGRTGAVTPVANLEPVYLAGTTVKRASLYNAEFMRELDLHERDRVYVEKGGEIIPKIVGVNETARQPGAVPVDFIARCPACGTPLERQEGEVQQYCPNEECLPRVAGKIEHFVSRKAMSIETMGSETIDLLLARGMIRDASDIYALADRREELIGLEKIIYPKSYEMTSIPLWRVIYAFEIGLKNISVRQATGMAERFGSLARARVARPGEWMEMESLGDTAGEREKAARRIAEYFLSPFNEPLERLEEAGETDAIPLDAVIRAMGIPGVGRHEAALLAVHYDYIYDLFSATAGEIAATGIGEETARRVHDFLAGREKLVRKLNTLGVFRLQEKSVDNLLAAIERSKETDLPGFIHALGIRHVGETASRDLARHFKHARALASATREQLTEVEGVGEQMARSVERYFGNEENRALLERLLARGVNGALREQEGESSVLEGKTFVITGTLSMPRERFKARILAAGGKVSDAVSAKTSYLLAGENAGSKLKHATKLGVPVLAENDLDRLLAAADPE